MIGAVGSIPRLPSIDKACHQRRLTCQRMLGLEPSTQGKATFRSILPPPPLTTIVVDKGCQCCRQQQQSAPSVPSHRCLPQRRLLSMKTANAAVNDNDRRRQLHPPTPLSTMTIVDKDCQRCRQQQQLSPTAPSHCLLHGGQLASTKTGLQTNAGSVPSPQGKATVITTM